MDLMSFPRGSGIPPILVSLVLSLADDHDRLYVIALDRFGPRSASGSSDSRGELWLVHFERDGGHA
jgi:hypothetical protein